MHHTHQLTAAIEADSESDLLDAVLTMHRELSSGSRIGTSDGKRRIAYTYHVDAPQVELPIMPCNEPFGPSGFGGEPERLPRQETTGVAATDIDLDVRRAVREFGESMPDIAALDGGE